MTGILCWTCGRILMAKKVVAPTLVDGKIPPGTKIVVEITCHACKITYRLTREVVE